MGRRTGAEGFTLIELSIVLVIIGLVVGGVLVGQDLIRSAGVRAQISQIEKYQTAVNTFRGKYGALPGDLNAATAAQYGFDARGTAPGMGDGNGVLEGYTGASNQGWVEALGETVMLWVDLTKAGLIQESFRIAQAASGLPCTTANIPNCYPAAKIGSGNYVYAWSGGLAGGNSINYFGLSAIILTDTIGIWTSPNLPVYVANRIDSKIDDGLPTSGSVVAMYLQAPFPAMSGTASNSMAVSGSATTCFDNGGATSNAVVYSLTVNNGAGPNCALSFQFQ